MTTQELKEYINKVLGNSIRCLLPSFWWKRLFGLVVDRIEEVENAASGNGITIVSSEEELNTLDLPNGSIASVSGEIKTKFSECYSIPNYDFEFVSDDVLSKLTHVPQIEAVFPLQHLEGEEAEHFLCLFKDGKPVEAIIIAFMSDIYVVLHTYPDSINNDDFEIYSNNDIEKVNQILASGTFYYVYSGVDNMSDADAQKFDDAFYIVDEDTSAYIKGDSWERLAKESDINITLDSELSKTSKNAVQNKVIAEEFDKQQCVFVVSSDGTAPENYKQQNKESYNKVCESIDADRWMNVFVRYSGYFRIQVDSITFSGSNELVLYATFNDSFIEFRISSDGSVVTQYSGSLKIDSSVSTTSTNAVQNKVITASLNNKVDKVNGKQLSTEDFTSALKTKLEGLNNYDDTSIQNAVNSLTTQINTLVSGDASSAIESFNEIIAFLNGVEDSENLDSIIAAIEQQIAAKQDKLVSGTNIKTINGESILGEGNIAVDIDTGDLATKEELNAKQDVIEDLVTIRSGAEKGATALQTHQDISHLATKAEVQTIIDEVVETEEIYAAAVNDLNTRIDNNYQYGEDTYATKESLNTEIQTINTTILDNEEVIAATLTDLNNQIASLNALIIDLTNRIETLENA